MLAVLFMKEFQETDVNDRAPRVATTLLAHGCLLAVIVADFFRRSSEGAPMVMLSGFCVIALLIGGLHFVANPYAFFFMKPRAGASQPASLGKRLLAWPVVVVTPVLWLLAVQWMPDMIRSELLLRLVMSYLFFAWIAAAVLLSPYLFRHS